MNPIHEQEVWLRAWCAATDSCDEPQRATEWADECLKDFRFRFPNNPPTPPTSVGYCQEHMVAKGRQVTGVHCGQSKLTEVDVLKLRALHVPGKVGPGSLSKIFGVDKNTIRSALRRKTWKHL